MDAHLFSIYFNQSRIDFDDKNLYNETTNVSGTGVIISNLLCALIGFISGLTVCGNLLVIIAIFYFKQLHTPTNYLILSLAGADLLVGVLVLPLSIILILRSSEYVQNVLCQVRSSCDIFLSSCSILNLCFISVDRYHAVCQPLRYRTIMSVRVTVLMILVSWTLPALIGIAVVINSLKQDQSSRRCVLFYSLSFVSLFRAAVVIFYLPAAIMFIIYLKIFMVAQRQARSIKNTACLSRKPGEMVSKTERKATKTLAIVMGIFLICWTPFFLCRTFNPFSNNAIPVPVIEMFKGLGWSNSMLNPFVYGFFYSWFRSACRIIISRKVFRGNFKNSKLF